jgi:hypothetical protein
VVADSTDTLEVQLHFDVFGGASTTVLPDTAEAAFAGDQVVVLQPAWVSDAPLRVSLVDRTGRDPQLLLEHPAQGYGVTVSPDGRHALVRGYDDDGLLLVVNLTTGEVVAESHSWWYPTPRRPWVGPDRILEIDEDSGGMDGSGIADHRVVDLSLAEVSTLPPLPMATIGAFDGAIVIANSDGLTVLDEAGEPIRTLAAPWVAGAWEALLLRPVASDPDADLLVAASRLPAVDGSTTAGTPSPIGAGPDDATPPATSEPAVGARTSTTWPILAVFGLGVGLVGVVLWRRHDTPPAG